MAFSMATRTHKLAQPKANRLSYPDRRSVYWLDELPPERTGPHTKIHLTPRWSELCRSKKLHTQVTLSPIWEVSEWALRAVPSKRLCSLAQPRAPAAGWEPERPLLVPLNRATQTAVATARVSQLAQPKRRQAQENSGHKSKPVSMTHLPCRASAHTELLSTPKHEHPGFAGGRSVCWPISRAARSYVAGERLLELSVPKARKALFEGYDPYIVSRAARSASPSPRIQELSLPLPRKCSSK
ncbi:theg spermatid protein [Hippoglossus stenolepis]|uniref:theg spermatid protein n=1 Tax=Hippoglossus stenolepis TaxID=195615 RepID=UPI001FAF7032|nr:theg spermatid protein [Hippoglossus stenolepis]XP_035024543.2 theg spermatid protein [Hippoglossus stenolepis]